MTMTNDNKAIRAGFRDAENYWAEMGRSLRRAVARDPRIGIELAYLVEPQWAYGQLADPDYIDDAERFLAPRSCAPALPFPSRPPAALVRAFQEGA